LKHLRELQAIDSIIFDLDGTLWNASETATKAWNRALIGCGYNDYLITVAELQAFTGIKIEVILKEKFGFMGEQGMKDFLGIYKGIETEEMGKGGGILYPEVERTLKELSKAKKLFIVSNCLVGYIENFFTYTKLEKYFTGYESTGRTGKSKHENIIKVIEGYRLKNAVYVGDTENDARESKKAGIPFVFVQYGFGALKEPEYKIEEISELLVLG
jgi:phosphoglycolate phosphatase